MDRFRISIHDATDETRARFIAHMLASAEALGIVINGNILCDYKIEVDDALGPIILIINNHVVTPTDADETTT